MKNHVWALAFLWIHAYLCVAADKGSTLYTPKQYQHAPGAKVLLIVNKPLTEKEKSAWEAVLASQGDSFDVWDVSQNQGIDLARNLNDGTHLMENYAKGMIIVVDDAFPAGTPASKLRTTDVLDANQMQRAIAAAGIHLYTVGGKFDKHRDLWRSILLSREGDNDLNLPNESSLIDHIRTSEKRARNADHQDIDGIVLGEQARMHDDTNLHVPLRLGGVQPANTERAAVDLANALQKKLQQAAPDLRFIIEVKPHAAAKRPDVDPDSNDWEVGEAIVRQTTDASHSSAVSVEVSDSKLHDPEFILSKQNRVALLLARSFSRKLEILKSVLDRETQIVDQKIWGDRGEVILRALSEEELNALIDSIAINLAEEQAALRTSRWNRTLTDDEIREKMRLLKEFSEFDFPYQTHVDKPDEKNDAGEIMAGLLARIRFLLDSQVNLLDRMALRFLGQSDSRMTRLGNEYYEKAVSRVFGSTDPLVKLGSERGVEAAQRARAFIAEEVGRVRKDYVERRSGFTNASGSSKDIAINLMRYPGSREGIATDADVSDTYHLVVTPKERAALGAIDKQCAVNLKLLLEQ